MADDITLTVRVRDMTRGDFNRLDHQLDSTRRHLDGVSHAGSGTNSEMGRMEQRLGQVQERMQRLGSTGQLTSREMTHMRQTMSLMSREALQASRTGDLTRDQYRALRNEIGRTRIDFDSLTSDLNLHRTVMRDTANDADRLRMAEERLRLQAERQRLQAQRQLQDDERLRQSAVRLSQTQQTSSHRSGSFFSKLLRVAVMLSPALIPIGAVALSVASKIVASFGTAAVALGAFGLALFPAISGLMRVREAQKSYNEAVDLYGASSKKARSMQGAYNRVLGTLSPEVQKAAVAFGILGSQYGAWSKSLESSTVPVLTKSFAVLGSLLPHLTGLVSGTSVELNRMVTILGGAVQTPGFSRVMNQFTGFADKVMANATNGLLTFLRAMDSGVIGDKFSGFISYVQEVGPAVGQTLKDIGTAFNHLVEASSGVGVVILRVVSALANIVSAIPSDTLANLLLFAFALKTVGMAAAFLGKTTGLLAAFRMQAVAAGTAAAASSGALQALGGAFMALSRTAKVAVIGSVIGAVVVGLHELAEATKAPPTNMDKLAISMTKLGQTGKTTGELTKIFGKDMKDLDESVRAMVAPSTIQQLGQFRDKLKLFSETDTDKINQHFKDTDEVLSNMAKSGNAEMAAAAFKEMSKSLDGMSVEQLLSQLPKYDAAVQNLSLEQKLAAASMGLFGTQAQEVQQKLESQKASADGLRQSIIALNEVNLAASGAMNAMEAAIDDGAKAAGAAKGSVDLLSNGMINMDSSGARDAEKALREVATTTMAAAAAAADQGASWQEVQGIFARGEGQFRSMATTMTGTTAEANILSAAMFKIPNREVWIKMIRDEAITQLNDFNAKVKASPGVKQIHLDVLSAPAEKVLTAVGYKVTRLPDGSVTITGNGRQALGIIGNVEGRLNMVDGMVANTFVVTTYVIKKQPGGVPAGTYHGSTAGRIANGGILAKAFAQGGKENHIAQIAQPTFRLWSEPETGGEAYIPLAESKRQRSTSILSDVANQFGYRLEEFAKGGKHKSKSRHKNPVTSEMLTEQRSILGSMQISALARMTGSKRNSLEKQFALPGSVGDLISTINEWRNKIKKATSGNVEKRLLAVFTRQTNALVRQQMALTKVNKALDGARDKLKDLKDKATQLAESVKTGIIGSADITQGVEKGKGTSTGNIIAKLQTSQRRASEFDQMLKTLRGRGLGGQALSEIGAAGLEGGGFETAKALMKAGSGDLKRINTLQGQIAGSAGGAGKTVADGMYAAGIKAAEGIVKGLEKQQKRIAASMLSLTLALEKALKRALGRKGTGGIIGAAGGGPRGSRTLVGEYGAEIVDLPYGSMVHSNADSRRIAGGGGGGQPIELVINLDGRTIARQIFDPMRAEVWHRSGGNVQKALGRS